MHGAPAHLRRVLIGVHAVEPDAVGMPAKGIDVGQRRHVAAGVPFLAGRHAALAADSCVEVDDEPELFLRRCGKAGH